MDHATAVLLLQGFEPIASELEGLVVGQASSRREAVLQGLPFQEVHHIEMQAVALFDRVNDHDGRMPHLPQRLGLAHESRDAVGRDELGPQHFDGHQTVERDLPSEVDGAHSAAGELPQQLVVGRQRRTQTLEEG